MGLQLCLPLDATAAHVQVRVVEPPPAGRTAPDTAPRAGPAPLGASPAASRSRRRELQERLGALCREPVRLVMHDNRSTMVSGARHDGVLVLRLHHMFLDADDRVLAAVARFGDRPDRWSRAVVDAFIEQHGHLISAEPRIRDARTARGRHHDLEAILAALSHRYFDGRVQAQIGFGEAGHPRGWRRRAIKLGSYDDGARRITVHPALDQARVPRVFVEYIVFHEMLHQVFPPERIGLRTRFHGPRFREAERRFEGRREALTWYRAHDDLILRFRGRRRGRDGG